jgi:hypothetical protein
LARGEKLSVQTFLAIVFVGALCTVCLLFVFMDEIKNFFGVEKAGEHPLDKILLFGDLMQDYWDSKETLQLYAMRQIKVAFVQFYTSYDKVPESLEELVETKTVARSILRDVWDHEHKYIMHHQEVYLISSGADRIFNTDDDIYGTMMAPDLQPPDELKEELQRLVAENALGQDIAERRRE